MAFYPDDPGEPVPEKKTFIHLHPAFVVIMQHLQPIFSISYGPWHLRCIVGEFDKSFSTTLPQVFFSLSGSYTFYFLFTRLTFVQRICDVNVTCVCACVTAQSLLWQLSLPCSIFSQSDEVWWQHVLEHDHSLLSHAFSQQIRQVQLWLSVTWNTIRYWLQTAGINEAMPLSLGV